MIKNKIFFLTIVIIMLLAGCDKKSTAHKMMTTQNKKDIVTTQQSKKLRDDNNFNYASLKNKKFEFLSGSGGWRTEMYIKEDGSFHGVFSDSDAGDEEYPNGVKSYCEFNGKFGSLYKIDDLTYKTRIEKMSYIHKPGTKEVINNILYKYTEVYGLEKAEDIIFFLPDTKIKDLPEDYLSWVKDNMGNYGSYKKSEKLNCIGLYNKAQGEGFSSYSLSRTLKEEIKWAKEDAKRLEEDLKNNNLSQKEMNDISEQIYERWDYMLNRQWYWLKEVLSKDKMEKLTKEQKKWIRNKENRLKKIKSENGSIATLDRNLMAADITEKRVYELDKYFLKK